MGKCYLEHLRVYPVRAGQACGQSNVITAFQALERIYVTQNLQDIEYRTIPLDNVEEARAFEMFVKYQEKYIFSERAKEQ